jgi:isocitrate/isopropylmalate dehydrogenase
VFSSVPDAEPSSAVAQAVRVLQMVAWAFGHELSFHAAGLDLDGLRTCREADAALCGRAESLTPMLSEVRRALQLFACARAVRAAQLDVVVVSDHGFEGSAAGSAGLAPHDLSGSGLSDEVMELGCRLARARWGLVTAIDPAFTRGERSVAHALAQEFRDVAVEREPLATAAHDLAKTLKRCDVVATTPSCARWLTDDAAALPGASGVTVEAWLGEGGFGIYQPTSGSALPPAIAAAMLLRHSLGLSREAVAVETAVASVLVAPSARDQVFNSSPGEGARALTDAVCERLSGGLPYSQAV